jgi:putative ABC transport system permease protein
MNNLAIVYAYLRAKPATTLLHILLVALGVGLMIALLLFHHQLQQRLYRDVAGVDLVVGAKGSPLQLILSTLQHADIPTGNIRWDDAERLMRDPQVKQVIPLSLGDNYKGYRIVGTQPSFLKLYSASLAEGRLWKKPLEAVIGAALARKAGLKIGDTFAGSHGLEIGGEGHEEHAYEVVGILAPTGTVIDRLIVTSLESVWDIHASHDHGEEQDSAKKDEHDHAHDHDHSHDHDESDTVNEIDPSREVTALLVTYRTRLAAMNLPQQINRNTTMQAASPAMEMTRLVELIGIGTDSLLLFGMIITAMALGGIVIGLLNNLDERRYDIAIMRTLGATKTRVLSLVLIEGLLIVLLGSALGTGLGHLILQVMPLYSQKAADMGMHGALFIPQELWMIGLILALAFVACLVPACKAYRTDIQRTLIDGSW